MESRNEVLVDDGEQEATVFLGLNAMGVDDNIDFAVLTAADIKEILKEHDTVYDYLEAHPWDVFHEVPVTENNAARLRALVESMDAMLKKGR